MSEIDLSNKEAAYNPIAQVDSLLLKIESIRYDDYQQVIVLASEAHVIAMNAAYWRGVAKTLYFIADGYLRLGNYASASEPAQQALITARHHELPIEEAYALSALGAVYSYLGDESEAMNMFFMQLDIAQEHKHLTLMGYAYGDLGAMYLRTDDFQKGLELIEKSNQLFDSMGREEEKYIWYFDIGGFYTQRGDYDKAYNSFEQMYRLGESKRITEAKILGLTGMARAKSDMQDYNIAHTYLDQALSIVRTSQSLLECEVMFERGKIFDRQHRPDKALEAVSKALKLATQTEHWNIVMEARRLLCDVSEKLGDFQQALIHNRAYHETRDKNFNDRSYIRTQALRTLYEIETVRKEAEIHQLRSEAAEHELNEYKQAEAGRLELERLKVMLEKERDLVTLKDRILTRISHEFRTPLAIIRTSTEILTRYADRLTEEKRETYQGRVDEQFKLIEKHLSDIGMVLKTDYKEISSAKEETSLEYICKLAIRDAQFQTSKHDRICLDINSSTATILIEKQIVLEVMTNLLSNALKFSTAPVQFNVTGKTDMLLIDVLDTGIGIPADEQEKVFESLYRASNNDEVRGNGLGLTIVRDYVALIGGTINLQSTLDKGTHVTVKIPFNTQLIA
ncbi:MAG: ATP-binding protein [Chloroflexota bacterium]